MIRGDSGLLVLTWNRFKRNRLAFGGFLLLLAMGLVVIAAPRVTRFDPNQIDLGNRDSTPTRTHVLGTDGLGRDELSRILHAGRFSLSIGLLSAAIATAVGTVIGGLSGYYLGWVDQILMRFTDLILSIPPLPLIIVLSAIVKPTTSMLILIIALRGWMSTARVVRSMFLSLREENYVEAARASGCTNVRIIFRHILPNTLAPITVAATLAVGSAIITESVLSYLGMGVRPPTPSWGNMLEDAKSTMATQPWLSVFPGMFILITVLSVNALGDGLRDAFDVRMRQ